MSKEPLITRSALHKQRGEHIQREIVENNQESQSEMAPEKLVELSENQATQPLNNPYRKTLKQTQPMRKTRSSERQRSRRMNAFLIKSIVIVALLIVVVAMMIWFL